MSSQSPATRTVDRRALAHRYCTTRDLSVDLASPLTPEDMVVQVETCASPTKWHLGHTTWFFETFVLLVHDRSSRRYDPRFDVLFNSYYNNIGRQHPRSHRGVLTRPSIGEVMAYRDATDDRMLRFIERCPETMISAVAEIIDLGLNHEQQHQELLLTDIKLTLHANPIAPAYREVGEDREPAQRPPDISWRAFEGGVTEIGHAGVGDFIYDNEGPRHRRFLEPFELADRPITSIEYMKFVDDGGYDRPEFWLDAGWRFVRASDWRHPMYWRRADDGTWLEYTLDGLMAIDPHAPACHLSFFEADAYARWAGARLPTEDEWEHVAHDEPITGNFIESGRLHPTGATSRTGEMRQMFGDVWEWTRSAHEPYPGYAPPPGAIGEYNGKFMCGSFVLRGGSCATNIDHIRRTYRNFFEPEARWQFSGIRLARSQT